MTSSAIRIDLDAEAQAGYVTLSDEPIVRTRQLTDSVLVDLDAMDMVVGIEVLSVDAEIPFARLESECHVHSNVIELLRLIKPNVGAFVIRANSAAEGTSTPARKDAFVAA